MQCTPQVQLRVALVDWVASRVVAAWRGGFAKLCRSVLVPSTIRGGHHAPRHTHSTTTTRAIVGATHTRRAADPLALVHKLQCAAQVGRGVPQILIHSPCDGALCVLVCMCLGSYRLLCSYHITTTREKIGLLHIKYYCSRTAHAHHLPYTLSALHVAISHISLYFN